MSDFQDERSDSSTASYQTRIGVIPDFSGGRVPRKPSRDCELALPESNYVTEIASSRTIVRSVVLSIHRSYSAIRPAAENDQTLVLSSSGIQVAEVILSNKYVNPFVVGGYTMGGGNPFDALIVAVIRRGKLK